MTAFPSVPKETYSPVRFTRDRRRNALPIHVYLGGEIYFENEDAWRRGRFCLAGQGETISFELCELTPLASAKPQLGDKVLVKFTKDAITADGVIQKIESLTVLCLRAADPVPMKAAPPTLAHWARFIDGVRSYFKSLGFLEVLTPSLVRNPGMEPELEPFGVELRVGSKRQKLFLPTSPELHIKQLMAQGLTDVFEIKTCFRNGEITELHEPEFQMLEWYRAYATLDLIREDLVGLLKEVGGASDVTSVSMAELFKEHLRFDLTPVTGADELRGLCRQLEIDVAADDDWNELFHRVFVEKIEPHIPPEQPTIVYDFPPSMAALARLTPAGFADRFELFWRGAEIANAFHELNDPVEQRRRFENEIELRRRKGRGELTIDENFMKALEAGLPPAGGIALGLDRLFMAMTGIHPIQRTRAFAIDHQLKS